MMVLNSYLTCHALISSSGLKSSGTKSCARSLLDITECKADPVHFTIRFGGTLCCRPYCTLIWGDPEIFQTQAQLTILIGITKFFRT